MNDKHLKIFEGLKQVKKVEEANVKSANNKEVVRKCKVLLKMIDSDVDITSKNKLKQIIMYSESENVKTDIGTLDDAIANLDLFLKTISKLEV